MRFLGQVVFPSGRTAISVPEIKALSLSHRPEKKQQTPTTRRCSMKGIHTNVAYFGGTVVIAFLVMAFVVKATA